MTGTGRLAGAGLPDASSSSEVGQAASSMGGEGADKQQQEKTSYARFCQMLRHSSAKPLVAKAHKFVVNFEANLPREEASDRVHDFLSRAEEWMFSKAVVFIAEADEDGKMDATEGLEKFLLSRLYPKIFAADEADRAVDAKLQRHIIGLSWVEMNHLGIPLVEPSLLPRAIKELQSIDEYKAPRDKLVCILNACKVITDILKRTHAGDSGVRPLSADDFLPLLIYLVIQANPPRLHSNAEYMAAFRHPSRLMGEDAYYVTTLQSAKEFLISAGPDAFEVPLKEYRARYAAALEAAGLEDRAEADQAVGLADRSPQMRQPRQVQAAEPAAAAATSPQAGPQPRPSAMPRSNGIGGSDDTRTQGIAAAAGQNGQRQDHDVPGSTVGPKMPLKPAEAPTSEVDNDETEAASEMERVLFTKRQVLVYKIPPAASAAGHKADDWKDPIFKGPCRVVAKGKDLSIRLIENSSSRLFAQCCIPGGDHAKYVEAVTDSSRYFVLKIVNGKRHAFLGLGFEDRNDSFDFKCTLNDFAKTMSCDHERADQGPLKAQVPAMDLSLKDGQKITINLKGVARQPRNPISGSGSAGLLAPPPAAPPVREATGAPQAGAKPRKAEAPADALDGLSFGGFVSAAGAPAPPAAAPPPKSDDLTGLPSDDLDAFGGFQSTVHQSMHVPPGSPPNGSDLDGVWGPQSAEHAPNRILAGTLVPATASEPEGLSQGLM